MKRYIYTKRLKDFTQSSTITIPQDPRIITTKEQSHINNLPFFNHSLIDSKIPKEKQHYLSEKFPVVKTIFGIDPANPPFINHKLPKNQPIPFRKLSEVQRKNRLSVTDLATKSWCELRLSYDLYSEFGQFKSHHLISGTSFHQSLEDNLYGINKEWLKFNDDFKLDKWNEKGSVENLILDWYDCIIKLISLFKFGHAREIICHGLIEYEKESVLISGIIDHLSWKLKKELVTSDFQNTISYKKFDLFDDIFKVNSDIDQIIDQLKITVPQRLNDRYELLVADVKTRSTFNIPQLTSVLKATKLQLMYYKKFLTQLGKSPSMTYESLLTNAKRKNVDIDEPLDALYLVSLLIKSPLLMSDMRRLRDGKKLAFEQFDLHPSNSQYNLSELIDIVPNDNSYNERFREFFTLWERPVTLRYLAVRLSQLYHIIGSMLSEKLLVEYYCKGLNFSNVLFDFDNDELQKNNIDMMMFWFGKRDIEPIAPNMKNILTYCKYCDYRSLCSWKDKSEKLCGELGNELTKIMQ